MRVLVTGATGFVGVEACAALRAAGHEVRRAVRRATGEADEAAIGNLDGTTEWDEALRGVDAVLHLAARVHHVHDAAADPLAEYRRVNTAGTLHLARQAAAAGVRRFVYASTIKVNGEATTGRPFRAADVPAANDPYGISKLEAEQGLGRIAEQTGLEVVIVRPPLVYGPRVKGNFLTLLGVVDRGLPLPLGALRNRRSLVSVTNLADLLRCAIEAPAGGLPSPAVFLVSDDDDVSTPELLRRVAGAMGRRLWLPKVPAGVFELVGRVTGRREAVRRLTGSLQVDIAATRSALGWQPVMSMHEELARTVSWYRSR